MPLGKFGSRIRPAVDGKSPGTNLVQSCLKTLGDLPRQQAAFYHSWQFVILNFLKIMPNLIISNLEYHFE